MPDIKLPDGKKISFSKKIDGFTIANKINKSLVKEACVMSVDGELKDLTYPINVDAEVKIITIKDKEGLEVIRHDAAHVLAMAIANTCAASCLITSKPSLSFIVIILTSASTLIG